MTQDAILAMEAGMELDALVAEMLMGWKLIPARQFVATAEDGWAERDVGTTKTIPERWESPDNNRSDRLHSYSARIAAAWEVVEKLRENKHFQLKTEDIGWMAKFGLIDPTDFQDMTRWAFAHTAPLAICRAALLTTLAPKDGGAAAS